MSVQVSAVKRDWEHCKLDRTEVCLWHFTDLVARRHLLASSQLYFTDRPEGWGGWSASKRCKLPRFRGMDVSGPYAAQLRTHISEADCYVPLGILPLSIFKHGIPCCWEVRRTGEGHHVPRPFSVLQAKPLSAMSRMPGGDHILTWNGTCVIYMRSVLHVHTSRGSRHPYPVISARFSF